MRAGFEVCFEVNFEVCYEDSCAICNISRHMVSKGSTSDFNNMSSQEPSPFATQRMASFLGVIAPSCSDVRSLICSN